MKKLIANKYPFDEKYFLSEIKDICRAHDLEVVSKDNLLSIGFSYIIEELGLYYGETRFNPIFQIKDGVLIYQQNIAVKLHNRQYDDSKFSKAILKAIIEAFGFKFMDEDEIKLKLNQKRNLLENMSNVTISKQGSKRRGLCYLKFFNKEDIFARLPMSGYANDCSFNLNSSLIDNEMLEIGLNHVLSN